jgi:hypothetical protein
MAALVPTDLNEADAYRQRQDRAPTGNFFTLLMCVNRRLVWTPVGVASC